MSQFPFLLTLTFLLINGALGQLGHGEDCQLTPDCDTTIGLECRDLKCTCIPDSIYDEVNSTCLILTGAACEDFGDDRLACVSHARCEYNGTADGYTCQCSGSSYVQGE